MTDLERLAELAERAEAAARAPEHLLPALLGEPCHQRIYPRTLWDYDAWDALERTEAAWEAHVADVVGADDLDADVVCPEVIIEMGGEAHDGYPAALAKERGQIAEGARLQSLSQAARSAASTGDLHQPALPWGSA